jgi:hypothetical protein
MNKVQSFIISNIVPTADSKMQFSNNDFNSIVYDQSNGYQAFTVSIPIPNSSSTFEMNIVGILVDFNATNVEFRINIDLNGLPTSILITGNLLQNDGATVQIQIADTISLGQDISEAQGEYIQAQSSLIISLLGSNIQDLGMMQYDANTTSFIMTADSFEQMMKVEGTNVTPLTVDKLKVIDDSLEVYCHANPLDPFYLALTQATDALETALTNTDLDPADFDITDPSQEAVVESLITSLGDVAGGITGGTLTEEDTNEFIETINQLSPENQQVLLSSLEENASSAELLALYDSLFGLGE